MTTPYSGRRFIVLAGRCVSAVWLSTILSAPAQAFEVGGFEISGYTRFGAYSSPAGTPRGAYTLGGDTQKFRLGNEGDNGIELGIANTAELGDGKKLALMYMPSVWGGNYGTAQGYVAISGFEFAPEAQFWVGQNRLRLKEIHVVDSFMMDYGDNTGVGMTGLDLGVAKLGVGIFNSATFDYSNITPNNAMRLGIDLSDIATNAGGTLRVLATVVRGDFQMGADGTGLSVAHDQSDFLLAGLSNTLLLQGATGHVAVNGRFLGLGDAASGGVQQPGMRGFRIADVLTWQRGAFGGQALASYQTGRVDGGASHGLGTRDFSLGGRASWGMGENFKLLAEAGTTSRRIDGQAGQLLNKITIAPTLGVDTEFWSRPELRFYLSHISWNAAAAAANAGAGGFGATGRMSVTVAGVQLETWW
ncbi:MAG: carbohydrate porin [Gallionella sp.]|nr:carbohydrate porin [Gallionella sp.]